MSSMYSHSTRRTIESKVFPGVAFTLRAVSYGRRRQILARIHAALEGRSLRESDLHGPDPLRQSAAQEAVERAYLEEVLVDVKGLAVDGEPLDSAPDLNHFLALAPERLVEEILGAAGAEMGLDEDQEKNFAPPGITSSEDMPGGMTAPNASARVSGGHATAAATTPSS